MRKESISSKVTGYLSLDMIRHIRFQTNPVRDEMQGISSIFMPIHTGWFGFKLKISVTSDMNSPFSPSHESFHPSPSPGPDPLK